MPKSAYALVARTRRQVKNTKPREAILGDGNGNIYSNGQYYVRFRGPADENGNPTYGPVSRAFGGQANFLEKPGRHVYIEPNHKGQPIITGPVWEDMQQAGIKPNVIHPNTPYRQFSRLKDIQNFKAIIINPDGFKIAIRELAYVDARDGSLQIWLGTDESNHVDLESSVPATANYHCYALISFSQDLQAESSYPLVITTSTPQAIGTALDATDRQEAWDNAPVDAAPIMFYRLVNNMPGMGVGDPYDIDFRQFIHMPGVRNGSITAEKLAEGAVFYQTIQDDGADVTPRGKLNFIAGANVSVNVTDNSGDNSTDVTITATPTSVTIEETDGSPTGTLTTLKVSPGTLTDDGGGTWTLDTSGSGSATTTRSTGIPNGSFEVWENGVSAAPDNWTVTGSGATIDREGTIVRHGLYSAKLTRVGNDCTFMTDMYTRAGSTYVRSRAYTIGAWVYATVGSRVRLRADDGVTVSYSSYHTGGSTWEWITLSYTPGAAVTQFKVGLSVDGGNTSGYLDAIALVEGSVMSAGYYPGTVPINSLPRRAFFDHKFSRVVSGPAITTVASPGGQIGGQIMQGNGAGTSATDAFENDFTMAAGTYTLYMHGETFTNRGISHIYIDDVLQGTIDWYTGGGAVNVMKTLSVTVIGDGDHVLKIVMATKNASASAYALNVPTMQIRA